MLILPYFALVQNVGDPFTSLDNNWYSEHWANDLIIAKECVEGQVYENAVIRELADLGVSVVLDQIKAHHCLPCPILKQFFRRLQINNQRM